MKKVFYCAMICALSVSAFTGCGSTNADVKEGTPAVVGEKITSEQEKKEEQPASKEESSAAEQPAAESITDEQALNAIQKYCYSVNPDLEDIVNAGEYPVYWDVASSDENEIVIMYRSYTAAQNFYYIDRNTGDTYVTEYVPGIMEEEQRTDESFNVKDYMD